MQISNSFGLLGEPLKTQMLSVRLGELLIICFSF